MTTPDRQNPPQQRLTARVWLMLFVLALAWGGAFPSTRAALDELGVATTVAFRITGGALVLWLLVLVRRYPLPRGRRALLSLVAMGLLNNVVPFTLIVWGQQHIASGLAAILNGTTALFTVLLAALVFPDERLTGTRTGGVLLGLGGVAVIVGPGALASLDPTSLGQIAVLGAALSYATAGIFARRALAGIRPEVAAAGMLTAAACLTVPAALWREGVPALDYRPATWAALAYLTCVATAFAYLLYYAILRRAGAGNLSIVTLMIGPVSIVLGAILFGEVLSPSTWAGFGLLAAGLIMLDSRVQAALVRRARIRTGKKSA